MRLKGMIITVLAASFVIFSANAFGQRGGKGQTVVHPRGYIGPPIVDTETRRIGRMPAQQITTRRYYTSRWQTPGRHRGWKHKKYAYGYRNYGQYRRTQVGNRRFRLSRPSWADRVRISRNRRRDK